MAKSNTSATASNSADKVSKKKKEGPKKACSSYIYFTIEIRPQVKAENPNMSNSEIMSEMGRLWKLATDEIKQTYQKLADADKQRYETEKAQFEACKPNVDSVTDAVNDVVTDSVSESSNKKGKKKSKDSNLPTKPPGQFIIYSNQHRAEVKDLLGDSAKQPEISKKLGEMWRSLSSKEKEKYINLAAKYKEEYEQKIEEYKSNNPDTPENQGESSEKEQVSSKKQKKQKDGPKRPISTYQAFSKDNREKAKELLGEGATSQQIFAKVAEMWNTATESDKLKYKSVVDEDRVRYERELAEYK